MQEKRVLQFLKFRKNLRYKGTQGSTNVSYSYLNMYSLGLNGLIECRLLNIFELVFVQSGWCGMECGFVYILFYNLQLQYAWWELLLCSWGSIIPRPLLTSWTFPLINPWFGFRNRETMDRSTRILHQERDLEQEKILLEERMDQDQGYSDIDQRTSTQEDYKLKEHTNSNYFLKI